MIAPEQLTAALERLDSRDWEVLDLSLRRRVPDEAMAQIFDCEPAEVARRRASAIESLADDLGVQRGEDLGTVLKALLDPGTWSAADAERPGFDAFEQSPVQGAGDLPPDAEEGPDAEDRAPEAIEDSARETIDDGRPETIDDGAPAEIDEEPARVEPPEFRTSEAARLFRINPDEESATGAGQHSDRGPEPYLVPRPEPPAEGEHAEHDEGGSSPAVAERAEAPPAAQDEPAPLVAPSNGHAHADREPVLDMLADRDQERRRERMRAPFTWVLAGTLGAALLFGAGFVGATVFGNDDGSDDSGGPPSAPRRFVPNETGPLAAPFPSDPRAGACYTTAAVSKRVTVHQRPGSRRTIRLKARTEWNSPRIFSVVRKRGAWLAILAPELENGEVGWMRASSAKLDCVRWSLHADLSRRRLYVRKNGQTVHKYRIAIGTRRNPTPKGRFAVTDKLKVTDKGSPYGCCVLALTGHQTKLPEDWPGGDRLAVHATSDLSSLGKRSSLGCMRIRPRQAGWLINNVPLGTPIFIRA